MGSKKDKHKMNQEHASKAEQSASATLDFRQTDKDDAKSGAFPVVIPMEYRVDFTDTAYKDMMEHASITVETELCGVLIGEVFHDSMGFYLKVNAAIEGKHSNNYGAQVTFTHDTWQYISEVKDSQYPDQRIVGWYHTHPGFGVFLSGMDNFIQENFFNAPYQVAVVIETKEHVEGCFAWVDGKSQPLSRFWIDGREHKLATGAVEKLDMADTGMASSVVHVGGAAPEYGGQPVFSWFHLVMAGLFLLLGVMCGKFSAAGNTNAAIRTEVLSVIESAAIRGIAQHDMVDVRKRLAAIRSDVAKNGERATVLNGIKDLDRFLDSLQTDYDKHREHYREELLRLSRYKQTMGRKVDRNLDEITELRRAMSILLIYRAKDMFDVLRAAGVRPTPQHMEEIRQTLDGALAMSPEIKDDVQKKMPELFRFAYPPQPKSKKKKKGGVSGGGGRPIDLSPKNP